MVTRLRILEEGNDLNPYLSKVRHEKELIPPDSDDEVLYKFTGEKGAVVITYDRDFKGISQKGKLYKGYKSGVVYFRSYKKTLHYWDIVVCIITHWEDLKRMVVKMENPFLIEVTLKGLVPMPLQLIFVSQYFFCCRFSYL